MFKILIPAVAALGLVAFAAQTADRDPQSAAAASSATLAQSTPAQSTLAQSTLAQPVMGWSLHHEGSMAKLAYGVANSDQLALMMTCSPGDASAVVYGDVQPVGARLVRASMVSADAMESGMEESRIALREASLRGLADIGRIDVTGDAGVFRVTADSSEKQAVRAFIDYCNQARA